MYAPKEYYGSEPNDHDCGGFAKSKTAENEKSMFSIRSSFLLFL